MTLPLISLGSPHGIGYEIFLLSIKKKLLEDKPLFCIGSARIMQHFIQLLDLEVCYQVIHCQSIPLQEQTDRQFEFYLINIDQINGEIQSITDLDHHIDGQIAYDTILQGAQLVERGLFSALVTLPVSKENINLIDASFKGHTEFLMKIWREKKVFMTFVSQKIKILLLTTHIPLEQVSAWLTAELIEQAILTAADLAGRLKASRPICFLGLNPHAGENGLIGKEEIEIKKIIQKMQPKIDIDIKGPLPADTAFTPFHINQYSLYIAAYHDQGLIPFKMLAFDDGVNLSFGMKYIRTSVDHGTARELIGKKTASPLSFVNAYQLAKKLV